MLRLKDVKYFLTFIYIIISFIPCAGHAFYHSGKAGRDSSFGMERTYTTIDKVEKRFVVYDNFSQSLSKSDQEPLIYPHSDNFVPADLINSNIQLSITMNRPMDPEDFLTNLLYSDIKLRKLFEEREALEQRSRELLADLELDYTNRNIPRTEQSGFSITLPRQTQTAFSLGRNMERLNQRFVAVSRNAGMIMPYRRGSVSTTSLAGIQRESRSMSLYSHEHMVTDMVSTVSEGEGPDDPEGRSSPSEDLTEKKTIHPSGTRSSIPKLLTVIENIIPYLMSHKSEALIYLVILFIISSVISSLLSHRH